MRVVGYVRESADPTADRPAFTQHEELRRHAADQGYQLVAVCQDTRQPGHSLGRDGYLSLLGVIAAGGVDGVLLPGLATLSGDQIVQEVMLWDLRGRGVRVLSTVAGDLPLLDDESDPGAARMLMRDVLERVGDHARGLGSHRIDPPPIRPEGDVLVHLVRDTGAGPERDS